jgi:tRNA nucleotidyltransferase (CCA-adding enzyme)
MRVFRVGGSVRDELLGLPDADRDFVVVGATPEEMVARGFLPVGKDFPVFLHPQTREEYALARTERKSGRGYHGFTFHTAPDVTLEDDLRRRDLTINAMARAEDGILIDPFGGAKDLRVGTLRHVSEAFAEDPLRVLRVARFAARFGFAVAPETEALMQRIVGSGELAELAPERVWQELAKGLLTTHPSRMIAVLRACGALGQVLPEVDALLAAPAGSAQRSKEDRMARALDCAARAGYALAVRFAVLSCAGTCDTRQTSREAVAQTLAARLRVPAECAELAHLVARQCENVRAAVDLTPEALLALLRTADAWRRPQRLEYLIQACKCMELDGGQEGAGYRPEPWLRAALKAASSVDAAAIAAANANSAQVGERVRDAQVEALRRWRQEAKT